MTAEAEEPPRLLLLLTRDPVVVTGVSRMAGAAGLTPAATDDPGGLEPSVIVIDLDRPGALDDIANWRAMRPEAFIAGHLGLPQRERWLQAEAAGCDLVANRGALASQLRRKLPPPGTPRRRRLPLMESADLPGRIGLVLRAPDSPLGPIAVYHFSGTLYAVDDICPHSGETLSHGELDGCVVTCPRHGSRFDVSTGERIRGPADLAIRTHEVVEEDGFVYLLMG